MKRCANYEEMLLYLKKNGYLVREGISKKHGPYLAIRPPDSQKAFRTYTLGKDYQVQQLKKGSGQRIMCRILKQLPGSVCTGYHSIYRRPPITSFIMWRIIIR